MKNSRQRCAVLVGLAMALCSSAAAAEEQVAKLDELVVTATRDEVPIEQVGSSITVITAKEIEQQQKQTVADALRMVPGLDVVRSGGVGQTVSIYMRGAKSEHTLVLIDGIEMNDPSLDGGSFDFAQLAVDDVERIEVLRGPQSTLYGSHAMGGVINIITRKGGDTFKGYLSAEGGSFYTSKEASGISGSLGIARFAVSASRIDTDGISAANSKNGNPEKDSHWSNAASARIGLTPHEDVNLDLIFKYSKSKTELDGFGTIPTDDLTSYSRSEEVYAGGQLWLNLLNSRLEQKLGASLSDINRSYNAYNSRFSGQLAKFDAQSLFHLHETNDLTVGAEYKDETVRTNLMSEKQAGTTGIYVQDQINLFDAWFSTLGVRVDDHEQFGTKATYRLTTAYLFKQTDTKLKGSYGTGFKAPSLTQLYHPLWGGNADLKAERSDGWDVGIEQRLPAMEVSLGATWFRIDYSDMITWDNAFLYSNIQKAHTRGLELSATAKPADGIICKATYTYTKTNDGTTGKELARRPRHKASFDINYSFLQKANLNLGLIYVGSRYDDTANNQTMPSYTLVNLAASYDVTKNLQLFGRIDNLLDREYEEVYGYGTPGIGAYGGVKVSF